MPPYEDGRLVAMADSLRIQIARSLHTFGPKAGILYTLGSQGLGGLGLGTLTAFVLGQRCSMEAIRHKARKAMLQRMLPGSNSDCSVPQAINGPKLPETVLEQSDEIYQKLPYTSLILTLYKS